MSLLEIRELCKHYPGFSLENVHLHVNPGEITGLIGRNGAGKSTTLKSLIRMVQPDHGSMSFFGLPFCGNEREIKNRIGFVSGGVSYYPRKKLRDITCVTRSFYDHWQEETYQQYMRLFSLDENKTPAQLSSGMQVKYALTLALSHGAELLILDEPTSGLDPVSREELLDIFLSLRENGTGILFSTHLTDELEKCADNIVYISKGRILADENLEEYLQKWRQVTFENASDANLKNKCIGLKKEKHGYSALIREEDAHLFANAKKADLHTIMVHMEGGEHV